MISKTKERLFCNPHQSRGRREDEDCQTGEDVDWEEESPEMGGEAGQEEGNEAERPLGECKGDGQEADPGVEAVGVGNGRLGEAVAVIHRLYSEAPEDCCAGHH